MTRELSQTLGDLAVLFSVHRRGREKRRQSQYSGHEIPPVLGMSGEEGQWVTQAVRWT